MLVHVNNTRESQTFFHLVPLELHTADMTMWRRHLRTTSDVVLVSVQRITPTKKMPTTATACSPAAISQVRLKNNEQNY